MPAQRTDSLEAKWIVDNHVEGNPRIGIRFECPICKPTHPIVAFFDKSWATRNGRYAYVKKGDSLENVTLEPDIVQKGACRFKGRVRKGRIMY